MKLITVLALFLGWEFILVIYIGVVLGGLVAIVRVATKNLEKDSKIPLSPFFFVSYFMIDNATILLNKHSALPVLIGF